MAGEVDMVNHPPHYTSGKYEVIDVLEDWFAHEPLLWQTVKYLGRWDKKGDPLENLEKAEFYLKRKIQQLKLKDKGFKLCGTGVQAMGTTGLNNRRFTGMEIK